MSMNAPGAARAGKDKPRILIAYTGGTIGMKATATGFSPAPGYLQEQMEAIQFFSWPVVPRFEIQEFSPLLDSSDMTPANWLDIARAIEARYDEFDGFLVVHGTDTMAFTASALSFMLEGLAKPVFLTGSQIPLCKARGDGLGNLLTSLIMLGRFHDRLHEVFVYFDNQLFRGNRVKKVDSDSFSAFASPNMAPVARCGIEIEIDWNLVRPGRPGSRAVVAIGSAVVGSIRIFPGIQAQHLENMLAPPVQGIVLECYGSGNAPGRNRPLLDALKAATDRGVVIVAVTQPMRGSADLTVYANGRALLEAGVVSGFDMTAEAALAKLYYLFETGHAPAEVRRLVQVDLRGELTPPDLPAESRQVDSTVIAGARRNV